MQLLERDKVEETLHNSRESMRAPLHPRLTPDPPSASEISTGDFVNRDYESHATYKPGIYSRPSSSHAQSGARKRGQIAARQTRGAILPKPRLCALLIPVARHLKGP